MFYSFGHPRSASGAATIDGSGARGSDVRAGSLGSRPVRVVVVGQTPPPLGGQALAIESLLQGSYGGLELHHVRMRFSSDFREVGRLKIAKLPRLLGLVVRILWCRLRTGADTLYYPPAGPDLFPLIRDIVVLMATRWAFKRTIFHFHAGGLSELSTRLPKRLKGLLRAAYGRADLAIQPSSFNPPDGEFIRARKVSIVANGIPDEYARRVGHRPKSGVPCVLYVGVLRESKGLLVLVDACRKLLNRGVDFELHLMGQFSSDEFGSRLESALDDAGLSDRTVFLGVLSGDAKWEAFERATVFCYPSHFESETFGLVLLEAMQFRLPVVATAWRGIPSIVKEGVTGYLVGIRDSDALAERLELLLSDAATARELGDSGRDRYLAEFTEEMFRQRMEEVIVACAQTGTTYDE